MPTPMIPLVHLNGTSGENLLRENRAAARAIETALEALIAGGPNARDYYVIDAHAFPQARDEHHARLTALHSIKMDLDIIGMKIADQIADRDRRKS